MTDYLAHVSRAEQLLAMVNPKSFSSAAHPEIRIQMAQVEALLALAAAIAGRRTEASTQPPQYPQYPPRGATDSR
ncbi:hypothetical protein [Kitasatospora sp. DSM 101779]|uniref:hypothetical protein n=1 Tax=Kitasatospora sp. DSM 101779 TaxID=2853165 RepID=UPI0021D8FF88|nr:hypothetical protein [Kitasatospora sp. DSM 101779]MCU7824225.1 hypothetical protein [Kitasatospora sp. DSM 101779]